MFLKRIEGYSDDVMMKKKYSYDTIHLLTATSRLHILSTLGMDGYKQACTCKTCKYISEHY